MKHSEFSGHDPITHVRRARLLTTLETSSECVIVILSLSLIHWCRNEHQTFKIHLWSESVVFFRAVKWEILVVTVGLFIGSSHPQKVSSDTVCVSKTKIASQFEPLSLCSVVSH